MSRKLLFVVNEAHFFLSHRLPLAQGAASAGFEVHVATRAGEGVERIQSLGFRHYCLPLSRSGQNLFAELYAAGAMFMLFCRVRPDVVHLVTIKPVLYGGIAARLARVPGVVAAVSGLGFVFIASGIKAQLVRRIVAVLYRFALGKRNLKVIFQNPDDRQALLMMGAVTADKAVLIRGSGVNLSEYAVVAEPDGVPSVVMATRILRDKGVGEFVEAARLMHERGVVVRCVLVGAPDSGNPTSVTPTELKAWREEGHIEMLGFRRDMAHIFGASNLVVLPSYYGEGLPKVLVEAAACGRAVITTDTAGCRDAIDANKTGLLVPMRNARVLADVIQRLLDDTPLRHRMGKAGRELAEREFAIENVVAKHLELYRSLDCQA